jgi:hypothetical protein
LVANGDWYGVHRVSSRIRGWGTETLLGQVIP